MLTRIFAIGLNTYREAVRARVLYGLLGAALATSLYAVVVATLSLHDEIRVIADVGSASMSLYAVVVAIVLGSLALHREVELKTLFPILTRKLRRSEYVVGKYFGLLATLLVFVAIDGAVVLGMLALEKGSSPRSLLTVAGFASAGLGAALRFFARHRVFVCLPWSLLVVTGMYFAAESAGADRQLVVASAVLTMAEVAIVAAIALFFSSFSSPFLTAIFTLGVWLVGRSSDTLAHLPERLFGTGVKEAGAALARILPNLQLYVPPRPVLLGRVPDVTVGGYLVRAGFIAAGYASVLLAVSAATFRRRDFT